MPRTRREQTRTKLWAGLERINAAVSRNWKAELREFSDGLDLNGGLTKEKLHRQF